MILSTLSKLVCFLVPLVVAALSDNTPVHANVRVEGDISTLYDGDVLTQGHVVNPLSGESHHCDGTNYGAHPSPVPVATAALDDASKIGQFTWDGQWYASLDDFLVTQIAGVPASVNTPQSSWFLYLNYEPAQVGGCQLEIKEEDEVLWAFSSSLKKALHLTGPRQVVKDSSNKFHVIDGSTGKPIAGASVQGNTTDDNGDVWLTFLDTGMKSLKAEKSGTIRSNMLQVEVIVGSVMHDPEDQITLQQSSKEYRPEATNVHC